MIRSYVIHMARSTARAPLVDALRVDLPNLEIVEAVDGRALSDADRAAVTAPHLTDPRYPFALLPGEIGCFLSHRRVWQTLLASDAPYAFVAEDDIRLESAFETARAAAEAVMDADTLIRFPLSPRETPQKTLHRLGDCQVFRPRVIGLTTGFYMVGRTAAQKLLHHSERFDRPVDSWLQMRWVTGVDALVVWPAGVASAASELGGSTIQKRKSVLGEVTRSVKRARYRAAIKRLSAHA